MKEEQQKEQKQQRKAMKEFYDGKVNIKSERQTDGSCDRTEIESSTDSSVKKKTCHKNLGEELFVYTHVGTQKKMLKLVEMDTTDGSSSESLFNFIPSDMDSVNTSD